ncbi:hypothetical protein NHX12_011406, partial [Muraenolepis orangiensis]
MLYRAAVLVFLVGVTDGVKVLCNATRPHGDVNVTQCFGPLGGAVEVQLVTPFLQDYQTILKKNGVYQHSSQHFELSTGIFTVKDIKRSDDAEYSIEIYNDNGTSIAMGICSLSVQAPVSSPLLSLECLASGEQRVSCSAEGDALRYGWSLDGNPLVDTHLLSGSGATSHMTLKLGLSGVIKCSVSNDVSISTTSTTVSVCVGVKVFCNATRPHGDVNVPQCFGPLGGAVECLASGEQRVSCSAEGDALRYGWSLDGNPLVDTHLLSGSGATSHMTLKLGLSGVIKCSVSNDVSISTASKTV